MEKHQRFVPSGQHSHFNSDYSNIADYVADMRRLIQETRCDLAHQNTAMLIDANAPRQNTPAPSSPHAQQGIILIHGLMDSAYIMSSLYEHFDKQGYKVLNLLLPGHGTRPGDLLDVKLESWFDCVQFSIAKMRTEVSELTVVGFSLGAALALHMKQLSLPIDKLILFAPALQIKNKLNKLMPLIYRFKDRSETLAWINRSLDLDYTKYQSLTVNAAYQVSRLIEAIHKHSRTSRVDCPCMSVLSHDDETIVSSAAITLIQHFPHPHNHIWLYSNHQSNDTRGMTVLPSHYPAQSILHFSHTALTIAPHDSHYGEQGDFRDFEHYRFNKRSYQRNQHRPVVFGAVSYKAMQKNHLQRLHYNPDFDAMIKRVDAFLALK